ncbi:MAG: helix-turn-helix domain-containing protein [Kibdelosporangium sp.]
MAATRSPRRADSQRNYERLLAAADQAFAEHGTGTSLEAIARAAGVATGTLYSHFPNRVALIGALLRDRHRELFALGDRLLALPSPAEGLTSWIHAVVKHAATYQGLAGVLVAGLQGEASELHAECERMTSLGEQLTHRAADVLRPGTTSADVFAVISSAAWVREQVSAEQSDRLLAIAIDGLLHGHATPPSQ